MNGYYAAFCIQFLDKPDAYLDSRHANLCEARRANYARKPIYFECFTLDMEQPSRREVPSDELCQCCETKLAKLMKDGEAS